MNALRAFTHVAPEKRLAAYTASLSANGQAKRAALGLDKPLRDEHLQSREYYENSEFDAGVAAKVPLNGEVETILQEGRNETLRVIRFTFARLLEHPTLYNQCLAIAAGVLYTGDTEVDVAKRYKVSRACVSKLIKNNQILLGNLPPTGPCRTKNVCRTYTRRARAVHLSSEQPVYHNGSGRHGRARK